jgi:hypothetical protein
MSPPLRNCHHKPLAHRVEIGLDAANKTNGRNTTVPGEWRDDGPGLVCDDAVADAT